MWTKHRGKLMPVLVLLQIVFLVGIAGSYYAAERFGQPVRIRTAPVDPRDIVYGDYVTLSYEISSLNRTLWKSPGEPPRSGETVYVVLAPQSNIYTAGAIYRNKPQAEANQITLKARVTYMTEDIINVRYGLERYYVQQNEGKALEEKAADMLAVVKVAPWGTAVLSGLEEER
ncbi:GDYXXLXY domain-containing protein [Paenibacillus chartarius]|uniref:GDYXXLXY domain-containing protein n=1 Tax=Paenibacillus chartarius TaxID=747481 RepID=A0ABV6DS84_9BACL